MTLEFIFAFMPLFRFDPSTTVEMEAAVSTLGVCYISPSSVCVLTSCEVLTITIFNSETCLGGIL